jgi:hypothetical protein
MGFSNRLLAALLLGASPALADTVLYGAPGGLQFSVTYEQSVTGNAQAAAIEAGFATATQAFIGNFSTPTTIALDVAWGQAGPPGSATTLPTTGTAASLSYLYGYWNYSIASWLLYLQWARNPVVDQGWTSVLANTLAKSSLFEMTTANFKAFGYTSSTPYDGYIGFGGNAAGYSYTSSISAGTYDFVGIAEHEISEVMGRLSAVGSGVMTPLDLYRYSGPGAANYSLSTPAYFSLDGGTTNLKPYNTAYTWSGSRPVPYGDRGDWAPVGGAPDAFDAWGSPGSAHPLSAVDLQTLAAIGWIPSVAGLANIAGGNLSTGSANPSGLLRTAETVLPEPPSGGLLALAAGTLLFGLRRTHPAQR